ncbi:uncharacterized protein [Mytilus edulis]|uniref:uncharacterized protein isoform X2 n=1 Tax=Mytilus edulis TaxID=6550 RepID=UPI0039EEE467
MNCVARRRFHAVFEPFLFYLLILTTAVTVVYCGQSCLSCSGINDINNCGNFEKCDNDKVCYLHRFRTDDGQTKYDAGCTFPEFCSKTTSTGVIFGKRDIGRSHIVCQRCCNDTRLCNGDTLCDASAVPIQQCLSCSGVTDPATCNKEILCDKNEVCYLHKYSTHTHHEYFDLGCKHANLCLNLNKVIFGRRQYDGHAIICGSCCNNRSLCNGDLTCAHHSQKAVSSSCSSSYECQSNLMCIGNQCQCSTKQLYWSHNRCRQRKAEGENCKSSYECETMLGCVNEICQCLNSSHTYWNRSACVSKKGFHDVCITSVECVESLFCTHNQCKCDRDDYWTGSLCVIKKSVYAKCSSNDECNSNLICDGHHCGCASNLYWDGNTCKESLCVSKQMCRNGDGRGKDYIFFVTDDFWHDKHTVTLVLIKSNNSMDTNLTMCDSPGKSQMSIDQWFNIRHINLYGHDNKTDFLIGQTVALTGVVSSEGISKQCAIIRSNDPVRIYAFLKDINFMEGFLVIPLQFLSTNYVIPSFFVQPEPFFYRHKDSLFAIGAPYSNTTANITLQIDDGSITYDGANYTTNQTISIVLNENTIFQLSHDTDLTGTTISASKPIAIVSGNRCNTVATLEPDSNFYCQPFMEMILPVNQLDNAYVIPKLALRVNSTVRILAVNHTEVTIQQDDSIISTSTIMSSAFIDFQYDNISSVCSMSDIMVIIYPEDQNTRIGSFMMTVTGIHQYLYEYDFIVPYVRYENFISITVNSDEINGFILDDQLLNVHDVFNITHNSDLFSSFSLPISQGEHYIVHATKARFGLWVYGDNYGYQGGMAFKT